jgi:hypothetical protein
MKIQSIYQPESNTNIISIYLYDKRKYSNRTYSSEFLNDVTVVVVFDDDPLYSQVKGFFE